MTDLEFYLQAILIIVMALYFSSQVAFRNAADFDATGMIKLFKYLQLAKEKLSPDELKHFEVDIYWGDSFQKQLPEGYDKFFKTFNQFSEGTVFSVKDLEKKVSIGDKLWFTFFLLSIIFIVNLASFWGAGLIGLGYYVYLPYAFFKELKESNKNIQWNLITHSRQRTVKVKDQISSVLISCSFFFFLLYKSNIESRLLALALTAVYPTIVFLGSLIFTLQNQIKWKDKWNGIFTFIIQKSINSKDILGYTIAKDCQMEISQEPDFPFQNENKVYLIIFSLTQLAILNLTKLNEVLEPIFGELTK